MTKCSMDYFKNCVEITYRVYYDDTECKIFNSCKKAKEFIKTLKTNNWSLNKYRYHHACVPWQDSSEISHG